MCVLYSSGILFGEGSNGELFIGLTFSFLFFKKCALYSMTYIQKVPRNNWGGIR